MGRFFHLLHYLRPYSWKVFQNVLFNVLGAFFALFSFAMVIPFLQVLFESQPLVKEPMEFALSAKYLVHTLNYWLSTLMIEQGKPMALVLVSVMVVIFSFLKNGFLYLANHALAPVRANTVRDIRREMYAKIIRLPLSWFNDSRKGDIMARISNDVQEIEMSIMSSLQMIFRDPLTILIYLGFLVATNWQLTIFILVILPVSGLLIGRIARSLRKKSFKGQQRLGEVMSIIEESLGGLRIIKGFNGEQKMERKFDRANTRFAGMMRKVIRRRQLAGPLSEFLGTIVLMILMAYGGSLVLSENSTMTSENLIFFLVVFSQVLNPVKNVSNAWFAIQKGMASVQRIDEILEQDIQITELPDALDISSFSDKIEFRKVSFKYDNEWVLREIDLTIQKGELVALVGRSGAGKSTLVDLLPRFMDPQEGEILIDGIPVTQYRINSLRSLMGLVSQESILFNDTFANNISFGTEHPDQRLVEEAARVANAEEFIVQTEASYESGVGEGGSKLSGGQKQRVSIARALMANPPVLILDEATSSLDTESERAVQDAIENLMKNRTSIVIAHRLSTIKNADKIVVLDEGRIVEMGKHAELVKKEGGLYRKLHEMQKF